MDGGMLPKDLHCANCKISFTSEFLHLFKEKNIFICSCKDEPTLIFCEQCGDTRIIRVTNRSDLFTNDLLICFDCGKETTIPNCQQCCYDDIIISSDKKQIIFFCGYCEKNIKNQGK